MYRSKVSALQSVSRFKGNLAATLEIIRTLVVCFLVLPNNVLYLLDGTHGNQPRFQTTHCTKDPEEGSAELAYGQVYIRSGIVVVSLGCAALVVCIVSSYFSGASKWKLTAKNGLSKSMTNGKSTLIVLVCLVIGNVELIMAVVAGCMELLYRPLVSELNRWHSMEFSIAFINITVLFAHVWVSLVIIISILGIKNDLDTNELLGSTPYLPQAPPQQQQQQQQHQHQSTAGGYGGYYYPEMAITHRPESTVFQH